jgi:hypothetical protein
VHLVGNGPQAEITHHRGHPVPVAGAPGPRHPQPRDPVALQLVQEGLPDVIPVEACYLGWQESLQNLAKLVEPEITQ